MLGIVATLGLWRRGLRALAGGGRVIDCYQSAITIDYTAFSLAKRASWRLGCTHHCHGWCHHERLGIWVWIPCGFGAVRSNRCADYSALFPVNQSLRATIMRFFVPQIIETSVSSNDNSQRIPVVAMVRPEWLAQWLVLAVIIGLVWYTYRRLHTCNTVDLQAAVLLPIMVLVMPLSWDSYMVYLLWPIALLAAKYRIPVMSFGSA
jgi:hypothetical protein